MIPLSVAMALSFITFVLMIRALIAVHRNNYKLAVPLVILEVLIVAFLHFFSIKDMPKINEETQSSQTIEAGVP